MAREFDKQYERFIDDLGGFLWTYKKATGKTWDAIRREANLAHQTVTNLADRKTTNPQGYTIWRVLITCDCSIDAISAAGRRVHLGNGEYRRAKR